MGLGNFCKFYAAFSLGITGAIFRENTNISTNEDDATSVRRRSFATMRFRRVVVAGKMSRGNTTRTHDREHDRTVRTTAAAMTSSVSLIDTIIELFGSPVQIKIKKPDG